MATFLLVHGACTGGWCWEKVVPLLEAKGHKVCAPDLPGLGNDQTPPAVVTLADNVEKLSRLLDKMDEPVVLVGHSLGGVTISALAGWLVLDGRHEAQRAAWALYAAGGCGAALLLSMLTTSARKKRRDGPGAPR